MGFDDVDTLSPADQAKAVRDRVQGGIVPRPSFSVRHRPDDVEAADIEDLLDEASEPSWAPCGTLSQARDLVRERMRTEWVGGGSRLDVRRRYRTPRHPASTHVPIFQAPHVEMLILRLLSATRPAHGYSVDVHGVVFTTPVNGWSRCGQRLYVSGLSPLIDDLGQCLWEFRLGGRTHGGRFYERDGVVWDAASESPIAGLFPG